jgi:fluoride exporter
MTPVTFIAVGLGGALGSLARFGLREWLTPSKDAFPWSTFFANLLGSFLLGIIAIACKDRPIWILFLGVGFCGGFTTFSTFSLETLELIQTNRLGTAMIYGAGSVAAGLLGVWLGMRVMNGLPA